MIEQQSRGVNNINLVTPTMYVYQIIEAIKIARKNGLKIPIIYNTNSYENVSTIRALNGYIDVYLPDLKYYSDEIAIKYSKAPNYFKVSTEAIKEMYKQVGEPIFDENGIIKKGVIIRHLILPNHIQNTEHILKWIKDTFDNKVYVSVMAQYFPTYKAKNIPELNRKLVGAAQRVPTDKAKNDDKLNRKISTKEYKKVENYMYLLGIENGYMQDLGKHEEEFVPVFDFKNV